MKRALTILLLLAMVCCAGWRGVRAAESEATGIPAGDVTLSPWNAGESYEGGSQADARLDKPVQEWRTGVPVKDLLPDLARQTGVKFALFPPNAEEARVCLTLYFNAEHPPVLRDVMAQVGWALGTTFGYAEAGGEKTYYLLSAAPSEGVAEKLAEEAAARREQMRTDMQARRDAARASEASAFDESRKALAMSQQDAAAQYRGVNDTLLLNLLDPARRAGLTFLTGLPEADTNALLAGGGRGGQISREWSAWSAQQQALLKQALGLDQNWPQEGTVTIMVNGRRGSVTATVQGAGGGGRGGRRGRPLGRVNGLLASGPLNPRQEATLKQLLGEAAPAAPAAAPTPQDRQAARQAQADQRRQQREQALAATRTLTPKRDELLAGTTLEGITGSASLWQLQEAVAKATGLNVVSDCFWLAPPRFFGGGGPGGGGGGQRNANRPAPNAREALSAACATRGAGFGGPGGFGGGFGVLGGADLGLQWGDAGVFLRFRSARADVWRAGMLSPEVLTKLDGWLEPYVKETGAVQVSDIALLKDVQKMTWLAGHVDAVQAQLGGAAVYGDLSDAKEAQRYALRRTTMQQVAMRLPIFRLLATFSAKQWEAAKGGGLKWGYDLKPDQRDPQLQQMLARGVPEDRQKDMVLQLGEAAAQTVQGPNNTSFTIPESPALNVLLDDQVVNQIRLSGGGFGGGRGPGNRGAGGGGRRGGGGNAGGGNAGGGNAGG